jgi:hypothetical protein
MKRFRFSKALLLGLALAGTILGLDAWWGREPSYQGRTVTAWLDRLVLYDQYTWSDGTIEVIRPATAVTNDLALHAVLGIGSNAVPVLCQTIKNRAEWSPDLTVLKRSARWWQWRWNQLRGAKGTQRPAPDRWAEGQRLRKNAAAFVLLALGTNAGAGFPCYMESYSQAPKQESIYGTPVIGSPVGCVSSLVVGLVDAAFPQRRGEMIAGIMEGLEHTNAWCRIVALESARVFPEALLRRKELLLKLTRDSDALVQETALGNLIEIVQRPALAPAMSAPEVRQAALMIAQDPNSSLRVRDFASNVIQIAEAEIHKPSD